MADDFLATYTPLANDIATRSGVDPSVVLGIIDTETGGGKHVKGNNIFGISPGGKVASYPDVQTASEAFISLMQTPRYRGVTAVGDPAGQAAALVRGGYNTVNPNYARLVAGRAQTFGKQLGYQDAAATAPTPPAPTSEKDKALADPALAGPDVAPAATPAARPATPPASEKDKALADPALQPTETAATTEKPKEPEASPFAGLPEEAFQADYAQHPISVPTTVADWRRTMAPEPGWVPNAVLPMATKEVSPGEGALSAGVKWDWGPIRSAVNPLLDLMEGTGLATSVGGPNAPLAGTVSPDATLMLLGAKMGNPNPFQSRNAIMAPGARDLRFGPTEAVPPGLAAREAPLSPEFRQNALAPDAKTAAVTEPTAAVSPTGIPVTPPRPEAPAGAQPAGAQVTPTYEAIHTPAEEAAYRANAEGQKLIEPQTMGEPDLNQYIPGETVNNAEREQTAKTARELKELGIRVPEASQLDKAAAESNNTARIIYAQNTAKGPVEIHNRRTARQTDIMEDKQTVFAPDNIQGPVDINPVIADMEAVLNEPFNRQNTALREAYKPWLDRLKAFKDGVIESPEEAWGLRYDIDQQTDKFAQRDNPNMHRVAHQLSVAAEAIDTQIDAVAPGYADMLAKYKEHSRAIAEMEVLQGAFDKLRGPGQKLTYNDFQRFMKNAVDSRMTPAHDLNDFKAISEENMLRLWNIRDSLRRSASALELAKAAGSDTMPNIIDALKAVGKMGGTAALHAYVAAHLGPGGNLALQSLGAIGKSLNDRRMIRRATTQMNQLLRPSEPLRVPPGQENPLGPP